MLTVHQESPRQPDVFRLVEALDAYLTALYPAESNHLLSIDALCAPDIRFFVARVEGKALGCGALRLDPSGYGEVKRMYVDPAARGQRMGQTILMRIEEEARSVQLTRVRLETGTRQPEALGLYRSAGYRDIAPFGDYRPDALSIFMEKLLQ
jgi:putative acetyltransferase